MRSIESTGKTVEEAIQSGLARLSLDISDVSIEILDEGSKGFFGLFGVKPAKVRLTEHDHDDEIDMSQILRPGASTRVSTIADKPRQPKSERPAQPKAPAAKPAQQQQKPAADKPAQQPKAEKPADKPAPVKAQPADKPEKAEKADKPQQPKPAAPKQPAEKPAKPAQPKAEKPKAQPADKPEKADKPQRDEQPKAEKPARQPHPPKASQPRPEPERVKLPEGPLPDQDPATLSELGRRAYEYLDKLTRLMGVPVKIYVAENDTSMSISMMGDTLGILIGRRGETLDALQYLVSLEVNKDRTDYLRVSLDTEHYRAKREDSLTRLAERMAARAVKTGRKVVLEPMNPYERRVLHSTLQNHPQVQTHSEGDEPNRRIVITLRNEAQGEAAPAAEGERAPRASRPRREGKPAEQREGRPQRGEGRPSRPHSDRPRPQRPAKSEAPAEDKPAEPVAMAHDVPSDPTDDTI